MMVRSWTGKTVIVGVLVLGGQGMAQTIEVVETQHMQASYPDFTSFEGAQATPLQEAYDSHAVLLQKQLVPPEYWGHPEFGYLPFNAGCDSCIELIHLRTARERVFVSITHPYSRKYVQASAGYLHYRDENGWWRTLNPYLLPSDRSGVFTNAFPDMRVRIDTGTGRMELGNQNYSLKLIENPHLLVVNEDGSICQALPGGRGTLNQVGKTGWRTVDLWSQVNREVVLRAYGSRVWLRYIFREQPQWLAGCPQAEYLLIVDTISVHGLTLHPPTGPFHDSVVMQVTQGSSPQKVVLSPAYLLGNRNKRQVAYLDYEFIQVGGGRFIWIIRIPRVLLDSFEFPVVVDPLVSVSGTYTAACGFDHVVPQPTSLNTCTDPNYCQCTLTLTGLGGTQLVNATYTFSINDNCPPSENCSYSRGWYTYYHDKSASHGYTWVVGPCGCENVPWRCPVDCDDNTCTWSCTSTNCNIHYCGSCSLSPPYSNPSLVTCLAPQCNNYTLNFRLRNWHRQLCTWECFFLCTHYCGCIFGNGCDSYAAGGCRTDELFIVANSWTVTVEGRTVEGQSTANGQPGTYTITDCSNQNVAICSNPNYGVPPYSTSWYVGATLVGTGNCITVTPPAGGATTTYTAVISDACGNTYTTQVNVVNNCPLSLVSIRLRGERTDNTMKLVWQIDAGEPIIELAIQYAQYQEEMDSVEWQTIASWKGDQAAKHAEWIVPEQFSRNDGIFRLAVVLAGGGKYYSNIVLLVNGSVNLPPPLLFVADGLATLVLSKPAQKEVAIYDVEGRVLWRSENVFQKTTYQIPAGNLPHLVIVRVDDMSWRLAAIRQ